MNDFLSLYESYINDSPVAFGLGFLTYAVTTLFASALLDIITIIYGKIKKRKK